MLTPIASNQQGLCNLVELQRQIEDASKRALAATQKLAAAQLDLRSGVASLGPTAPSFTVRDSVVASFAHWEKAVNDWHSEIKTLRAFYDDALEKIEISVGISFGQESFGQISLGGGGELEIDGYILSQVAVGINETDAVSQGDMLNQKIPQQCCFP